jgi:hypothetical protein
MESNPMYSSFVSAVSRYNYEQPTAVISAAPPISPVPQNLVSQLQQDANQFVKETEMKNTSPLFMSFMGIGISAGVFFIISFGVMNSMRLCVDDVTDKKQFGKMLGLSLLLTLVLAGAQFVYKKFRG